MPCWPRSCRLRIRREQVELRRKGAIMGIGLAASSRGPEQGGAGISVSAADCTTATRRALAMILSAARRVDAGEYVHSCIAVHALPAPPKLSNVSRSTGFIETLASNNPLLVKDDCDGGMIGAPAAINAVIDALWHPGVRDIPVTAETVWRTLAATRRQTMTHNDNARRRASLQ